MWFYCCQLSANETCSCSLQGEINDGKSNNFRVNFMHLCEKLDALSSFLLNRCRTRRPFAPEGGCGYVTYYSKYVVRISGGDEFMELYTCLPETD